MLVMPVSSGKSFGKSRFVFSADAYNGDDYLRRCILHPRYFRSITPCCCFCHFRGYSSCGHWFRAGVAWQNLGSMLSMVLLTSRFCRTIDIVGPKYY